MAGLYLHIPFCKQACTYCDFHFSTSMQQREELVDSLIKEIKFQADYLPEKKLDTIYFGGGTPSLLTIDELERIFESIQQYFTISSNAEITLEANPDDLTANYLCKLRHTPINRLSIGIQSFRDEDLKMMNRAHNAKQAKRVVPEAADMGFENLSVDLIYGIPDLKMEDWKKNLDTAIALPVNHLSCYCLTVEPRTALAWQVQKGISKAVDDDEAANQYEWLIEKTEIAGIPWYEVSNFGKPGFQSRHNSNYWNGIPYLGIGPSAHSFNGRNRQWNIRNNPLYIKSINEGKVPLEAESLTTEQRFNETVLTSLRTRKGLSKESIEKVAGDDAW
ncbi:MAG: radical SAM family heme chaperone HemW, partial [Pseudomonadota bacterium]